MSHESRPISPTRFASALQDLPVSNLYAKTFEIRNSIDHLQQSNDELQTYSDGQQGGDDDCLAAIKENEAVIGRMWERIELVRREVERRGGTWHEAREGEAEGGRNEADGEANGHAPASNGVGTGQSRNDNVNGIRGRLTDDELRRQLAERVGNAEEEGDEEGMHL